MRYKLPKILSITAITSFISFAHAQDTEVLNLELNCEGKLRPLFAKYEDQQRYNKNQKWAATAINENHTQRISIVENAIGEMPLVVADNWIKVDDDFIDFYKTKGVQIDGFIDRLIGSADFSITLDENSEAWEVWNEFSPMTGDDLLGMNGFEFNGICAKLDPEKKVF